MNQSREHTVRGQAFQVLTGFAQPCSMQSHDAHLKLPPNEMVQRDPASDQVSPRRPWRELNFLFSS